MTTATKRVQIMNPTYMPVGGQWQIVYPGSVIDLPAGLALTGDSIVQTFSEAVGTLGEHGKATPVRNFRTR